MLITAASTIGCVSPLTIDFINPEAPAQLHTWRSVGADGLRLRHVLPCTRSTLCTSRASWRQPWNPACGPWWTRMIPLDDEKESRAMKIAANTQDRRRVWNACCHRPHQQWRACWSAHAGQNVACGWIVLAKTTVTTRKRWRRSAITCARSRWDIITYVVNRNINFTNVCFIGCAFCSFSTSHRLPMPITCLLRRLPSVVEAREMGATEVCVQGGLPRGLDPFYYRDILRTLKTPCRICTRMLFTDGNHLCTELTA